MDLAINKRRLIQNIPAFGSHAASEGDSRYGHRALPSYGNRCQRMQWVPPSALEISGSPSMSPRW